MRFLAFVYDNIAILLRFEDLVQVSSLRLGSHESGILFVWYTEIAIYIAAGAKLDLKFSPGR